MYSVYDVYVFLLELSEKKVAFFMIYHHLSIYSSQKAVRCQQGYMPTV